MSTIAMKRNAGATARLTTDAGASTLRWLVETDAGAGIALVRVALALIIWPHGAQHLVGWFGGYGFSGTYGWMTADLGIPGAFAALAIVTEFFAPFALLAGLGGRIAALGVAGLMTGAALSHTANGFFMNWFGALPAGAEGFEYHLLAIAMALAVVIEGSGTLSVDRVLAKRRSPTRAS